MSQKEIIQKINDLYILYRKKWLKLDETGYKTINHICKRRNHIEQQGSIW